MPYNVSTGDIAQVVIRGTHQGQTVLNVTHYYIAALAAPAPGSAIADDLFALLDGAGLFTDLYADVLSKTFTFEDMTIQWIWPTRYQKFNYTVTPTIGQVDDQSMPSNVAWALTRRNDFAMAGALGTMHVGAVPLTWVTAGSLNATGAGARAAFRDVQEDILIGPSCRFNPCLFKVSDPGNSQQISSAVIRSTMRTMHRRTVGLGI